MTHKELTAHIRNRIKAAGIKAKVKMQDNVVAVDVPSFGAVFSDAEQAEIKLIAKCNGLTFARKLEIDLHRHTNPQEFKFYTV